MKTTKRLIIQLALASVITTTAFAASARVSGLASLRMPQAMMATLASLLRLHFDGSRRCGVFSGGRMSGYGVMLCLCGFLLLVLGSQPFRIMLEMFFVLFLLCLVAHRAVYGRYSH